MSVKVLFEGKEIGTVEDKILCAFDKKDVVDIVRLASGGSRIELADGSWFEVDKTVERMRELIEWEEQS
ncbi:hypothetical protein PPK14_gp05 [Bacillus phage vB_BspS_SplendidRed]|uniref:Uncharacterized protein n=1 Tax=Bacillus phage vB_BspS_SplendidRed TaxID=2591379 RepID=A0A5B9NIH6_9CAUD|nr:hypothetical protein PPK14_gp05 [Bacillus phage vB_BspS_SplendidRed]QEG13479.1 hypothetical protein SPLENDIDRED_5 [Bacillus phage vB_BspS_SplendidRed]